MLSTSFLIAIAALVAIVANPTVKATPHTFCYTYFMKQDGCVFSTADPRTRCQPDGHPPPKGVGMLTPPKQNYRRDLDRRYNTPDGQQSYFVAGGKGICGKYSTNDPGACLWTGAKDENGVALGGWLNDTKTSNCQKQVYIMRQGQPDTVVYVPVVDGCDFDDATLPEDGCFALGLTRNTFFALKPTQEEKNQGWITKLAWDFDNLSGQHTRNGPV